MFKTVIFICGISLVAAVSLCVGAADISPVQVWTALLGHGDPAYQRIVQEIRLPRLLLALVVGAGLGASGAALQGYTRNELAAPGLLGFSACAALGAVAALYFGAGTLLFPAAIIGALVGAIIISVLARRKPGASGLVLAGIGIGALATAVTGLLMNLAPNPWALSELVYWLMGSLKSADMGDFIVATPLTMIGLILLCVSGPALRVLGLGEDTAQSLGVSVGRTQILVVAGTALCIGAGVAVAGAIGFVGLFVPHILRFATDADEAALIPYSAMGGAIFLAVIDTAIRAAAGPGTPLYLGIVTSLIGVPFFLYLAMRRPQS